MYVSMYVGMWVWRKGGWLLKKWNRIKQTKTIKPSKDVDYSVRKRGGKKRRGIRIGCDIITHYIYIVHA